MRTGPTPPPDRRARVRRGFVGAAAAAMLILLPAAPALAHGGGDSTQSRVLVNDALTYLANKPAGYEDMVKDKIHDALDAPDQEGITLADVTKAQQAFEAGDLAATRTLLQQSVQPLTAPVTGEETGTTVMVDPANPGITLSGFDGVLAALSAAAVIGGAVIAFRSRPTESLATLNARLTGEQS